MGDNRLDRSTRTNEIFAPEASDPENYGKNPIECTPFEWKPDWSDAEGPFHIYLHSVDNTDQRFQALQRICIEVNEDSSLALGVTTTFMHSRGLDLEMARNRMGQLIDEIKAPDFLEKIEQAYGRFLEAKEAFYAIRVQYSHLREAVDEWPDDLKNLENKLEAMEEEKILRIQYIQAAEILLAARRELIEVMPDMTIGI